MMRVYWIFVGYCFNLLNEFLGLAYECDRLLPKKVPNVLNVLKVLI